MRTGRIKWFNDLQDHGYIILSDGTEIYFHGTGVLPSGLNGPLHPGTDVSFDLIETRSGLEAHNVETIG